jgi:hypothetical protein
VRLLSVCAMQFGGLAGLAWAGMAGQAIISRSAAELSIHQPQKNKEVLPRLLQFPIHMFTMHLVTSRMNILTAFPSRKPTPNTIVLSKTVRQSIVIALPILSPSLYPTLVPVSVRRATLPNPQPIHTYSPKGLICHYHCQYRKKNRRTNHYFSLLANHLTSFSILYK